MAERTPHASNTRTVVGKFYLVPCIEVERCFRAYWMGKKHYVPVIGPKHADEDLGVPHEHYHPDWRFIEPSAHAWGWVISNGVIGAPALRRRKCMSEMGAFPVQRFPFGRLSRFEQQNACKRLKPGNICPHRGIDLTPFAKPDGTAICPGHGLRWNLKTGELVPRHALEASP